MQEKEEGDSRVHVILLFSYMMGEEGFCLTTFDTALKYVEVMSSS